MDETNNNKEKAKNEIQEILAKYNCGIVMMPHLETDGIKITMDIINNEQTTKKV